VAYSSILDLCFIGNDMSRVLGSMDPIVSGDLLGLPWTGGNGGRHGSLELDARVL
jgi:hypothetical protein